MQPGTLVRVKEKHLHNKQDRQTLQDHGYLWLYIHDVPGYEEKEEDILRWYRSVATGEEEPWFDFELEGAD